MKSTAIIAVIVAATAAAPVAFQQTPTKEDAMGAMERATVFYHEKGQQAVLQSLQKSNSPLHKGPMTVFVVDRAGNVLADVVQPQQVGRNLLDLKDADGAFPYREVMKVAHNQGEGWVYYTTRSPMTWRDRREAALVKSQDGLVFVSARRD